MRSYAIVGTGAVGGYYGACLQKSGLDVHFLLRSDYAEVRENGLRVDSPKGDIVLPLVMAYSHPEDMPRCDVVVVAWKTTHNKYLRETLPRLVKPGGVVLVLQNGLDPEREVAPHAGTAQVLAGLCFLCSRKEGPGHIRHQDYGAITLAAYPGLAEGSQGAEGAKAAESDAGKGPPGRARPMGVTGAMRAVGADFESAGIEIKLHDDWRAARWRKLVWNIPFNGLCALWKLDTRALLAMPGKRKLVRELMLEVMAGAALDGCPLSPEFADRMLSATDAMTPYEPSMKLDRDEGRPMELPAIYGRTLEAIRMAGGEALLMESLLADLQLVELGGKPG